MKPKMAKNSADNSQNISFGRSKPIAKNNKNNPTVPKNIQLLFIIIVSLYIKVRPPISGRPGGAPAVAH